MNEVPEDEKLMYEKMFLMKKLAREGIEYYKPEINIVIGRSQSIPPKQWRRIIADNKNGANIRTYDELLEETSRRVANIRLYL